MLSVRALRLPFSEVRRRQFLRRTITIALTAGAILETGIYFGIRDLFRHSTLAVPVAAYVVVSVALWWFYTSYTYFKAGYQPLLGWRLAVGCLFGTSAGILVLGLAQTAFPVPAPAAAGEVIVVTVLATFHDVRWMGQRNLLSLRKMSRGDISRRAATGTYDACRRLAGDPCLLAEERKVVRLNLARAAIIKCTAGDAPDGLVEAADVLRELLADPPSNWTAMMGAAVELADASFHKASKHGDFAGYEEVLRLLAEAAQRMPPDSDAVAIVHQKQAEYQLQLASQLPSGLEATAQVMQAVASWRTAIDAVSAPGRDRLRVMHSDIGEAISRAYLDLADPLGDIETGIAECRTAFRLAGRSPRKRAPAQVRLAKLLVLRATERARSALDTRSASKTIEGLLAGQDDIAEAERLLRQARRFGMADVRANAAPLLATTAGLHAAWSGQLHAGRHRIAREWQRAADAMAQGDPLQRAKFAQGWLVLAVDSEEASWCAEAYWYLVRAIPEAVAVRYLPGERERVLAGIQSTAEEAGYWLVEADRVSDAAIALELGRAVSLTEILSRDRPGLEAALRDAEHTHLLRRYQAAVDDYGAATRPGDRPATPQRAWSRYVEALHEATAAIGIDMPQALPTLVELAEAARDGPLVYLAAADRGGYAIMVPAAGPLACTRLPRLRRSDVADHLESFLLAPASGTPAELMRQVADTLRWLWDAGIGELAAGLPAGALVTIVPVGLLSLLPVHAAGGPAVPGQPPEEWEFLADRVTIRYTPNARTLLRAQARAAALPDGGLNLLSVAAPDAVPGHRLPYAAREAEQIWRQWHQPADQMPVASGARRDVEPLLAERTVWHFACHCHARPDRILDSALILSGGELTLRDILALPATPRRLAILSACETHRSGTDLPDEATGLPTGLIQAGFAGVVASHWPVNDRSTSYLMTRFHDLWHNKGLPPAAALAEAQRWCRTATRADMRDYASAQQRDGQWPPTEPGLLADRPFRHPFWWAPFALTGQ